MRSQSKDTSIEISVTKLIPEPNYDAALLLPPPSAEHRPTCKKPAFPKEKFAPEPDYPKGGSGSEKLVVQAIIGTDGRPRAARIVKASGDAFDQSALNAIQRWVFEPAKCEGEPLQVLVNIEFSFHRY